MPAAAVAGWIRGRALLQRRLGPEVTDRLAGAGSLSRAVDRLSDTPYGSAVRPGMDLESAQRAVQGALLWNLRILAGWQPPNQSQVIRVLAGGFEIANVVDRLLEIGGAARPAPFALGSLSTAWPAVRTAFDPESVRSALARSEWGDPQSTEPQEVLLALRIAWARRAMAEIEPVATWARQAMVLLAGHVRAVAAEGVLPAPARRDLDRAVARRPRSSAATGTAAGWAEWWRGVEARAATVASSGRPGPEHAAAVVALLAADARRVGAALALAGSPGGAGEEVLGALA